MSVFAGKQRLAGWDDEGLLARLAAEFGAAAAAGLTPRAVGLLAVALETLRDLAGGDLPDPVKRRAAALAEAARADLAARAAAAGTDDRQAEWGRAMAGMFADGLGGGDVHAAG